MRPKKSVNELGEALRESTPPATAVPAHFRQQLRRDLQAQATVNTSPPLSRRWLLAPVVLFMLIIGAFWYALPKTAVEPAIEINTTRPAATPDSLSVSVKREQALQAALTFARRTDNKPIGGWLVETRVEAITSTATWEAYDVAVKRLGSFAIADYGGSNILFPENESERVWFVQLVGRWQPFGETADSIQPVHYVGVLVNGDTGQIAAAGSSTVPFVTEPIVLSLADYPPQERPYLVEQGAGFWLVHTGSQLLAFDRRAPYRPDLPPSNERPSRCLVAWVEVNGRFTDPCSGDEWGLDGTLNLIESTELWSNRNLDQYRIELVDGSIIVHLDEIIFGDVTIHDVSLGTLDRSQTDFDTVIEQLAPFAERRQAFLSGQSGWFYTAVQEYQPLDNQGEGASFFATFATEQMVSETWYHVLADGSADQVIYRYTNADGLVVALTIFIDGYYVNFFGDTIDPAPQQLIAIPNEAA